MGDKIIHDATQSLLASSNPRLAAAMGGNDKRQLALDIVFNDNSDDETNDSSPRDLSAMLPATGVDNCAPPARLTGRERPPPLTDDASISTSTRPPII